MVLFSPETNILQAFSFAPNKLALNHHGVMDPDHPYQAISDRLNRALNEAGYTKARYKNLTDTLKALFGVSKGTVSDWRHGKKCPTMDNALMIADKLGVCPNWLLTGHGPMKPAPDDDNGDVIHFDMRGIPADQRRNFEATLRAFAQSVRDMMADYQ